jgi:hypothetical protein
MSHLSLETLARLVDDAPDAAEKAHLEACAECVRELEDMRADLVALTSLPSLQPPAEEWETVEARLVEEGLLRRPHVVYSWKATTLRAAAAILIFLLGGFTGAAWLGQRPGYEPGILVSDEVPAQVRESGPRSGMRPNVRVQRPAETRGPGRDVPENVLAAAVLSGRVPQTREEATQLMSEAEALYLDAMLRVSELGSAADGGDPLARLAALEGITAITRAALDRAPADPVLNGYHITAVAQREATLRQLAAAIGGSWF